MSEKKLIGLSTLIALERQVEAIANNIANSRTAGYRGDGIRFQEYLAKLDDAPPDAPRTSSMVVASSYVDFAAGPVRLTGVSTDVSIVGEGFFQIRTPGGPRYTRDGAFRLNGEGTLVNGDGLPVETSVGVLTLANRTADISIRNDGSIWGDRERLAALKVVGRIAQPVREGGQTFSSSIVPSDLPTDRVRVVSGSLESSNVHAERELVKMVEAKRTYQMVAKVIMKDDDGDELRKLSGQ